MAKRTAKAAAPAARWQAVIELGDTEITLQEHADGVFTIDIPHDFDAGPLVLGTDPLQQLIGKLVTLGKTRGWL